MSVNMKGQPWKKPPLADLVKLSIRLESGLISVALLKNIGTKV